MRFFVIGFALLALASAGVVPTDYLPPLQEIAAPTVEYLPPGEAAIPQEQTILADDGYRYKTVKKFRLRHRRDVNEIANEYLPPVEEQAVVEVAAPVAEVASAPESAVLADDGYQYRTVKRYRLRRRRDVNEIANEYLPPVEESAENAAPVVEVAPAPESAVLADDGYRYRTVKRYRLRRRRDVNEIANEYLPPVEESVEVAAPVVEVAPAPESAVLADDGYQYRTVKRYRLRRRRDVNEIANEYLPPVEESVEVAAPIAEIAPALESAVLADDGYRYRTVKRYRLRRRRDVSEIVNEYLPPVEGQEVVEAPESAVLADDGYRYKTVRKLRYRYHQYKYSTDFVQEYHSLIIVFWIHNFTTMKFFVVGFAVLALAAAGALPNEYLPPLQEIAAPTAEYLPPAEAIIADEPTILADDGYRYKTVKRFRLRHRRDVNEIANEYLPPVEEQAAVEVAAPVAEVAPVPESSVLADDGYQYRTVKRYRLRRRRDVNEIANEYLPPVEEAVEVAAPVAEVAPAPESAVLADDGYQYRTVKRYRLRRRRDVNEIANEYLPPVEEQAAVEVAAPVAEVAPAPESAVLADDGYQYRTVKRYRLRRRRDVNEIANEYLPPVEEAVEVAAPVAEVAPAPESAVLADDGYQYRTVKRYRLRRRRDVNEIANEYLPPVEEAVEVAAPVAEVAPAPESAVLADDGYQYRTVKRYRLRRRRDVNEIANEYLPPVEEAVEVAAPVAEVAPAPESAILADDGYQYRTVKRYRLRRRRDVSEIANEYLPPVVEEAVEVAAPAAEVAAAPESAVLADDGYRYKTIRKLRYRYRH
ncbi:uncharacterized protein LOC129948427 [Eupeodes corollae]|uniref:uncharacterized protein LOC129948427 n=1 Tax=Eupeodes corollae TaxID=290404 RepID=UPI002493BB96|nr:uncharacterized protein LOC129948427 [Eupeodes corollae]